MRVNINRDKRIPKDEYRIYFARPLGVTNRDVENFIITALERPASAGDEIVSSLAPVRVVRVIK